MTDLEKRLSDIATNKIQPEDLERTFDLISIDLLRHAKLVAGQSQYLIREIEFYFSGKYYNHFDAYAHSNQYKTVKRQGEFGEWYFHRYKSADNYSKQKFRGLDISFGNKEFKNFGGILIRQIQLTETDKIVDGISNIVGEIINKIGEVELHNIATKSGKLAFDESCSLHLEINSAPFDKAIYKATRIIPKPHDDDEKKYYPKLYRYFNYPEITQVQQ
ncbi:MAG TPA: hypothetical protein VHZ50_14640 [Puia sp.]|jgi:hypothetical protein|nr:hypothetical protein [Puia sp.]